MAVAVYKTFVSGEVLTASDLNNSFTQITNNGQTVGWPATASKDLDGYELIFDADADTSITADTDDQLDFRLNAVDYFRMTAGRFTAVAASITTAEGTAVASAATTDIWGDTGNTKHITGTTTITSLGTAPQAGAHMWVIFDGALTLTHGANLSLPGSANITTAADDMAYVYADTTTQFDVVYFKKDGSAVVGTSGALLAANNLSDVNSATTSATNLGLGTGNSPQFTAVNIGHATDTTLTRTGAGDVAVEGNALYRAGGTDVPVTDGGTGASTAADAATNLSLRRQGLETVWVPAAAMKTRTTNGAASGTVETATSLVMRHTFDFDTSTQEFTQFPVQFPKSWNLGTVTFAPVWTAASGSGGVVFGLAGVALSDDDALNTAFGTAQTSTDTLILAADVHVGPTSSAITIAGTPAAGDWVAFQINRTVADAGDTLGVDANLLGIRLFFTTSSPDDT